jgi:hypothetical protein
MKNEELIYYVSPNYVVSEEDMKGRCHGIYLGMSFHEPGGSEEGTKVIILVL